ncbi:nucleolar protein 14 [Cladochytrium replicatum]|nr:nucleolar protein 14 [Cladochytrium replicatum]
MVKSKGGAALRRLKESTKKAEISEKRNARASKKGGAKHGAPKANPESVTRDNPFEYKITKTKHEVVNRNIKGLKGKPGIARQKAEEVRNKTLLVGLRRGNKEGALVDRRIGENDLTTSVEEKMMERFMHEKSRGSDRRVDFSLEEDLTHFGQSLADMDDLDTPMFEPVDESDGKIGRSTVSKLHFGGFDDEESVGSEDEMPDQNRRKSKNEVMKELIAKSKQHKYERQKVKEENEDLAREVDEDLSLIRQLVGESAKRSAAAEASGVVPPTRAPPTTDDDFDSLVRRLHSERRARATDRMKTDEEVAIAERERLETLENERLKRMSKGFDADDDSENKAGSKRKRIPQGDDLDDDFTPVTDDGGPILRYSEDGVLIDAVDASDSASESENSEEERDRRKKRRKKAEQTFVGTTATPTADLPYTFEAPENIKQFRKIVAGRTLEEQAVIVGRIRTLYHVRLHPQNSVKLLTLMRIVLEHILDISTTNSEGLKSMEPFQIHLFELGHQFPAEISVLFITKIKSIQERVAQGIEEGFIESVTVQDLVIFKIAGDLFSVSDYRHPVCTPMTLLMANFIGNSRGSTAADFSSGLFLITLLMQNMKDSRRVVPEAIHFLHRTIQYLAPHAIESAADQTKVEQIPVLDLLANPDGAYLGSGSQCLSLFKLAAQLVVQYAKILADSVAFRELFSIFPDAVGSAEAAAFGDAASEVQDLRDTLEKLTARCLLSRRPLQLQKRKAVPIATYMPKFNEKYSIDKKAKRAQDQKLRAEYKKEHKGAVRELRKDAAFRARQTISQRMQKDAAYTARLNQKFGQLGNEAGETKDEKKKSKKKW